MDLPGGPSGVRAPRRDRYILAAKGYTHQCNGFSIRSVIHHYIHNTRTLISQHVRLSRQITRTVRQHHVHRLKSRLTLSRKQHIGVLGAKLRRRGDTTINQLRHQHNIINHWYSANSHIYRADNTHKNNVVAMNFKSHDRAILKRTGEMDGVLAITQHPHMFHLSG